MVSLGGLLLTTRHQTLITGERELDETEEGGELRSQVGDEVVSSGEISHDCADVLVERGNFAVREAT